ncbi:MAG: uroporphyrinogen-III synthase [Sphingomicrobium sp.]
MRKLVILRPEPGASATFERAIEAGLDPVKAPLFAIEPIAWEAPDPAAFDGLLVTSANAFHEGGDALATLRILPVYAVGPATAEAAREAGFEVADVGQAGIRTLLSSIDPDLRLLHLAGEDRIDVRPPWQTITSIDVYRASALELADLDLLEGNVVLVHSPRAGAALSEIAIDKARTAVVAISVAAAEACGAGWEAITASDRPNDPALLALAVRLCEKAPGR